MIYFFRSTDLNSLQQLIDKLISYVAPIAMTICILVAVTMTIVTFLNGMVDADAEKRKQTIKKITWIWVCAGCIFLIPTFALILKEEFIRLAG